MNASDSKLSELSELPIVIVGAGPVGLAAAAHLVERGQTPLVLEAGPRVAASMHGWGHVRLFTPWSYLTDPASQRLLEREGRWREHDPDTVPLAGELVADYLDPLANTRALAPHIRVGHEVVAITREGHDRMRDGTGAGREAQPFIVVAQTPEGQRRLRARAIIDASGTWTSPNPMGAGGVEADGEARFASQIAYGMPDVAGEARARYEHKRVLVVGSGHSAIGSVLSLVELAKASPDTLVAWAIRGSNPRKLWGGGRSDQIAARGALGTRVHDAVAEGHVTLMTRMSIGALQSHPEGIAVVDVEGRPRVMVDEIIVATGARPNLAMLRELRTAFDPPTEASESLGPLIDPNHHSCGTVRPHGAAELAHPEPGLYVAGMKSYGRAPTFLLRTGYEQVRSIAAELAGDHEAARRVELELPQTGVCSTDLAAAPTPGNCC